MTTIHEDTAARDALAVLQESPRMPNQSVNAWLTAHQADVITLCLAKGQMLTCELLGLRTNVIAIWKHAKGLTFNAPVLSRDGLRIRNSQNLAPPRPPSTEPPVRNDTPPAHGEPAEPHERTEPANHLVIPTLRRANYARYIIMEDGRVLEIATGRPAKEGGS